MLHRLAPVLFALVFVCCSKADKPSEAEDTAPPVEAKTTPEAEVAPGPHEAAGAADDTEAAGDTEAAPVGGAPGEPAAGAPAAGEAKAKAAAAAPDDQPPAGDKAARPSKLAGGSAASGVAQGQSCTGDKACAAGLECIEYYGFAGPAGPRFASCEIRCKSAVDCPKGQICTTIADGPGQVCR